jgi:hypothetical protein
VKLLFSIIVVTLIMLFGSMLASGFSLLKKGEAQSINKWSYSFGNRYIYDNSGSRWNYDSVHKHKVYRHHLSNRHAKFWHLRNSYKHQSPMNEKLRNLIEHFSRHKFHHKRSYHPGKFSHHVPISRYNTPAYRPFNSLPN